MAEILVVDDVDHICMAVKKALEVDNHVVSIAHSGAEAMALLKKMPFDLIITDILMPQGDGSHLIRHIRDDALNETPVIAMSGGG